MGDRISHEALVQRLADARELVPVGSSWFHKGDPSTHYRITGHALLQIADSTSDLSPAVLYESPKGVLWARPIHEFSTKFRRGGVTTT